MKTRTGFVSNSSSSSFTCDVCNHTESGWDLTYYDASFFGCENGHEMCDSHGEFQKFSELENWTEIHRRHLYKNRQECKYSNAFDKDVPYEEADQEALTEEIEGQIDELRFDAPSFVCAICNMTEASDTDLLRYLLMESSSTKAQVQERITMQFTTYDKFLEAWKAHKK